MKYAITTLMIEKHKLIESERAQRKYSVYPEYQNYDDKISQDIKIIEAAIYILEEAARRV